MIISAILILFLAGAAIYGIKISGAGNYIIGATVILMALTGILLVARPRYSTIIANYLGVGRGADLLLYLFFMISVVFIFLVHIKFRQHDLLITSLARSIALSNAVSKKPGADIERDESE
jgi:small membrane protein